MAADLNKPMVKEKPQWIMNLSHEMTWAPDGKINDAIEARFHNYTFLSSDEYTVRRMLQNVNYMWREYMEELYKTTQYEYNPMENYDRWEEGGWEDRADIGARKSTGKVNTGARSGGTTENSAVHAYGYNADTDSPQSAVNMSGTTTQNAAEDTSESKSDAAVDKNTRTFNQYHVHGNIGVLSGQQMVQQSRDIIVDLIDIYVGKFANCFDLRFDLNEVI